MDKDYIEYKSKIPFNTVKTWSRTLMDGADWKHTGWSGESQEPYRHWADYPKFEGALQNVWKALNSFLEEDGIHLKVERIVMNLYNHGDSAWLHKDSDNPTDLTVILFLNEYWNINWGGDFVLVRDDEIVKSFAPTPGKFVVFKSNILHAARPVSREAPYPRFGIAFQCKRDDSNLQEISDAKVPFVSSTL